MVATVEVAVVTFIEIIMFLGTVVILFMSAGQYGDNFFFLLAGRL